MTTYTTFRERLNKAMDDQNMPQAKLCVLTGFSRSRISNYCTGVNIPRPGAMEKLAEALNVPLGWLTGKIDETEKSLTVAFASEILGTNCQAVREGLKRRTLPFGYAVMTRGGNYRYYISPSKFEEFRKTLPAESADV